LRVLKKILLVVLALVLLLAVLRWALFHGPRQSRQELADAFIVDLHCHVAGLGAGGSGCHVSRKLRHSYKFDIYLSAFGVTREEVEEKGDQVVVERLAQRVRASRFVKRAVVLALDGCVDADGELDLENTEIHVPNEFVLEHVARHDELLFGASIHPLRRDALERLSWAAANDARLIKWIPSIQGIDPSDERIVPFYRKMAELGIPLLSHAGDERSFTSARNELADPMRLRLPLSLGVTVIAAHIASTGRSEGADNSDRLFALMEENSNLYTEISSLTQVNKLGFLDRALRETRFHDRMLYGSDYPLINTLLVSGAYFPLHLSLREITSVRSLDNCLDQDVELKRLLGVPRCVFEKTAQLLRVKP